MDKYKIIEKIEDFAPPELAESWDCSGWLVETPERSINKIMLALTVTDDVVRQTGEKKCDMIISHHPLFCVPLEYKDINIYCAHTNMDRAEGGTTDTLINSLGLKKSGNTGEFTRFVNLDCAIVLEDFIKMLKKVSPNLRYVNNLKQREFRNIAFCAGSGSEFIREAYENGADCLVTGDLKFHTALESPIAIFDIGHFESEIMILDVFEKLLSVDIEVVKAEEKSPFIQS